MKKILILLGIISVFILVNSCSEYYYHKHFIEHTIITNDPFTIEYVDKNKATIRVSPGVDFPLNYDSDVYIFKYTKNEVDVMEMKVWNYKGENLYLQCETKIDDVLVFSESIHTNDTIINYLELLY